MKSVKKVLIPLLVILFISASTGGISIASTTPTPTAYDNLVLQDNPAGYWPIASGVGNDLSGHGLDGTFTNSPAGTTMPNGDAAVDFNGVNQYFTVGDNDYLEVTKTGVLTIEAWMRPDVLQFPHSESTGYVHWMGKGTENQQAYVSRMYNLTNDEDRPNRISGYAFNLSGGLGTGSYFQDSVTAGSWIHYALVINTVDTNSAYPTGYTKIYKNGVLRDQDSLKDYNIVPGNGTAPFRVGTRDLASFFEGAVGKVAVYNYELTPAQLTNHYQAMTSPSSVPLFLDTFESDTVGSHPANYSVSGESAASGHEAYAKVTDVNSFNGDQSLLFYDNSSTAQPAALRSFSAKSGIVSIQAYMKLQNLSWFEMQVMSGSNYVARIYFKQDGKIYYYSGSGYVQLGTYNANTWYKLGIAADTSTGGQTFDVYLNGSKLNASPISFYSAASSIDRLKLETRSDNSTADTIYVDDVSVS